MVLYAARSTKGILRLSWADRALVTIPDDLKEILVGILLGDGFSVKVVKFALFSFLLSPLIWVIISMGHNTVINLESCYTLGVIPILSYSAPLAPKALIIAENKGKLGIYVWENKINGKSM